MNSLRFEWDEKKAASNQVKHGVSFVEAKSVFADSLGRLMADPDSSEDEERFILMGMSSKIRLLIVCHCERSANSIRIISARKAEKFERKQYEEKGYA